MYILNTVQVFSVNCIRTPRAFYIPTRRIFAANVTASETTFYGREPSSDYFPLYFYSPYARVFLNLRSRNYTKKKIERFAGFSSKSLVLGGFTI